MGLSEAQGPDRYRTSTRPGAGEGPAGEEQCGTRELRHEGRARHTTGPKRGGKEPKEWLLNSMFIRRDEITRAGPRQ